MLAKLRVLLISVLALVAVPDTILADDSAKLTALEALLKQYMDENAELKKVIAEQGTSEPEAGGDVVANDTAATAESADVTERPELYSSAIICERAKLNDNEYGLVVKMDAQKYADEAERRGLNCADDLEDANTKVDKVCRSNLTDCSDEVLCELSTHNDGSVKWRSGLAAAGGYIEFVNEAQRRGLDCGVENPATTTKVSYTCENDPAYCDNSQLCELATYGTNTKVWKSGGVSQKFVDEAKRRELNCLVDKTKSCKDDLENCRKETLCKFVNAWYPGADKIYIDAAQARGLDCGVENPASSTKASYICENDPAYCDNSQLCEAAVTRIGGSVSWSSDPNKRFFVSEAKNRNISCGLTYPLASCAGWNGTVAKIEGVDTENAVMSGYVMEKDFREYCTRDPGGETTTFGGELSIDQCVSKYFSVNKEQVVTFANCNTGELVNEWFLAGVKKTSKETFPLGIGTDRSCASGLLPLEAQFSMLCPSNANSDDWIAAGQQRKADAENLTSDAEEQKRLADEKQKKADADAKAAEQKRLADEKQKKADADAQAVEQKRLADEEKSKVALAAQAAEEKRLADEKQKKIAADAQAAEQKRLADEKQKKADADALAAEQVRLAEEEKRKAAFAAQAAELKRLADEKQKADADALAAEQKQIVDENVIAATGVPTVPVLSMVDQSEFQQDLLIGDRFYNNGDYSSALRMYLPLAEQGSVDAQVNLSWMYEKGEGLPQDYAEALRLVRLAADQGSARGQNGVGYFYDNGLGVPQDYAEAIKWYRLAAAQGLRNAERNLGLMYAKGNGTPQDYVEAVKLLRLAADKGDGKAQYNLGLMYKDGNGVPQDDDKAIELLSKAADNGITLDAATQFYVGLIYQKRESYLNAAKWYQQAVDQDYVPAQSKLGILYANGRGVPQNLSAAIKWIKLAADQGLAEGQVSLGSLYENGMGVLQDYSEAMKLYELAADQGYADGQNNVGMMHINGLGRPQSYSLGIKWLRLAAKQNNAMAQKNLGILYDVAPGYPVDGMQSVNLGISKIQMDYLGNAQAAIGPKDDVTANMWYIIASSNFEESEMKVSDPIKEIMYSLKNLRENMKVRMQPSQVSKSQLMAAQCVNSGYEDCGW